MPPPGRGRASRPELDVRSILRSLRTHCGACRSVERTAGRAHADAVLADDRRRDQGSATGSFGCAVRPVAPRQAIDLRTLDRHRDAAVTSLIPALSCRSCRPNAPFAQLLKLSPDPAWRTNSIYCVTEQ